MIVLSKKTILEFDKNSRESYDLLKKKIATAGSDPTNVELFFLALAYGFMHRNKVDTIIKSGTGVRVEYLKPEHELLMSAIQLAETGNPDNLLNQEERFELAEKYAEGGVRLLKGAAEQPGDFLQDLAGQMAQIFSEITKANQ